MTRRAASGRRRRKSVEARGGGHQLWGGRFAGGPDPALEAVNRSIGVDIRLWPFDVALSKAWASALVRAGVLTTRDGARMRRGLDIVARRIRAGAAPIASDEDVHTFIDRLLHDAVGAVASRLHTGRSRNDQVATASRLLVMHELDRLRPAVRSLQAALVAQATRLADAIMPAYTHLQRAQPVSVAHWLLAHFWSLERDLTRLDAADRSAGVMPLGSGAIAGSAFRVNRRQLARDLGFHSVSQNSIDAVGDRDFMADTLFALTGLTVHLSRLAEDLILFGSSEFAFVRFGDAFSTGSSMMPQKRNPDALELARSSPARVMGDLIALLATLKGTPSGYNKDFQEDKRPLFDALDAVTLLLPAVAGTVRTLKFDRSRMAAAVSSSMMATDLADYLVRRGVAFRAAHAAVGALVREAEERGIEMSALPPSSFAASHPAFGRGIRRELLPGVSIAHREIEGGTGPRSVAEKLAEATKIIKKNR